MATYVLMACFAGVFVCLFIGLFFAVSTVERTRDQEEQEARTRQSDHRQPPMGHHLPTA
jgi:H+/gluconate symporter-like permease